MELRQVAVTGIGCVNALGKNISEFLTAGLKETEEECNLNYVKDSGQSMAIDVAISNPFGFGGHNSILIFKKYEEAV